jgi:hypothetical protein
MSRQNESGDDKMSCPIVVAGQPVASARFLQQLHIEMRPAA